MTQKHQRPERVELKNENDETNYPFSFLRWENEVSVCEACNF